jgi:ferric-dicitrate binding protein FerR (iron transport regulator)
MKEDIEISIAKALAGEASTEELASLQAWRTEDAANEAAYHALEQAWEASKEGSAFVPDADAAWERMQQRIETNTPVISIAPVAEEEEELTLAPKHPIRRMIAVAAAVMLLFGTVALPYIMGDNILTEEVALGDVKEILLADGSTVWLNQNSSLQYPEVFGGEQRVVILTGEAFFEITKNPDQPFVIKTEFTETKVLGTSFNLRAYPGETETAVSVATGQVSFVNLKEGADPVILNPGSEGVYNSTVGSLSSTKQETNVLAWKTKQLTFEDTPFGKVEVDLERCYGVDIKVENDAIAKCRVHNSFDGRSLEDVLTVIGATIGITFEMNEGVVTIQGEGCE